MWATVLPDRRAVGQRQLVLGPGPRIGRVKVCAMDPSSLVVVTTDGAAVARARAGHNLTGTLAPAPTTADVMALAARQE